MSDQSHLPDPLMDDLERTRARIVNEALGLGFAVATARFHYPNFSTPDRPGLSIDLWVMKGRAYSPDHNGFISCSPQEPDVLRELTNLALDWVRSRPNPLENKQRRALDLVKQAAEEAAAAGLTYQSAADQLASYYPEPEDIVIEGFELADHLPPTETGEPNAGTHYTAEDLVVLGVPPQGLPPVAITEHAQRAHDLLRKGLRIQQYDAEGYALDPEGRRIHGFGSRRIVPDPTDYSLPPREDDSTPRHD